MRNKWTLDKCMAIALRYESLAKYRLENNDAYLSAIRNGWINTIKKEFPENRVTKWSDKKTVIIEAKKYNSRTEFRNGSKGAYEAAYKNGYLDEACVHMKIKIRTNFERIWTKEKCIAEALKYDNRKDFQMKSPGAYNACGKRGLNCIDEVCGHMKVKLKNWTKGEIVNVAKNYKTRGEFAKKSKGAYLFALRRGWLNEICIDKEPVLNTWTKNKVLKLAKECKTRTEFNKKSGSALQYAKRNGFYEQACKHMKPIGNLYKRMIYVYEFSDKSAYIGLTYKESKRKYEHLYEKRGPVASHIKRTKIKPIYKVLHDYIEIEKATKLEQKFIDEYKMKGWNILNSVSGGALGGNKVIWTKAKCHEIARKFTNKIDFYNSLEFSGARQAASKHGWMEEICSHMKGNVRWSIDKCIIEAKKFKTKTEFQRGAGGAYNFASRNNLLDVMWKNLKK